MALWVNIVLFPTTLIANTQVASLRLCLARFPLASIVIVDPSLSCNALNIASFPQFGWIVSLSSNEALSARLAPNPEAQAQAYLHGPFDPRLASSPSMRCSPDKGNPVWASRGPSTLASISSQRMLRHRVCPFRSMKLGVGA